MSLRPEPLMTASEPDKREDVSSRHDRTAEAELTPSQWHHHQIRRHRAPEAPIDHFLPAPTAQPHDRPEGATPPIDASDKAAMPTFFQRTLQKMKNLFSRKNAEAADTHDAPAPPSPLQEQLRRWAEQGFVNIGDAMRQMQRHPWLATLGETPPAIVEQLLEIDSLMDRHSWEASLRQLLMQRLLDDLASTPLAPTPQIPPISLSHSFMALLGQLILALDNAPEAVRKMLSHERTAFWQGVEALFLQAVARRKESADDGYRLLKSAALPFADRALRQAYTDAIVRLLVVEATGHINFGLVPGLLYHFVLDELTPTNFDIEIVSGLKMLMQDAGLRAMILNTAPPGDDTLASLVVRGTAQHTAHPTTTTLLSALLSHPRQGEAGSCFAVFLAINILINDPERALADFCALLSHDGLLRGRGEAAACYAFLVRHGEETLDHPLTVGRDGLLGGERHPPRYVWELPPLRRCAAALQVDDIKERLTAWLALFYDGTQAGAPKTVTLRQLMKPLLDDSAPSEQAARKTLATIAMTTDICQPLQTAWQNAIAGMSENDGEGIIRGALENTLTTNFQRLFYQQQIGLEPPAARLLLERCISALQKRIRILYDPSIDNQVTATDQHSSRGGFVLCDSGGSALPSLWKTVDGLDAFRAFLKSIIHDGVAAQARRIGSAAVTQLDQAIDSDAFIVQILHCFNSNNMQHNEPLKHLEKMRFLPWLTRYGNDPKKVLAVYFEDPRAAVATRLKPANAKDLFKELITLCRQRHATPSSSAAAQADAGLIPIRATGRHTFTMLSHHPTFSPAWRSAAAAEEWIEKTVVAPGTAVAISPLAAASRKKLLRYTLDHLVPSEKVSQFLMLYRTIPAEVSVKGFRQRLLHLLDTVLPSSKSLQKWRQRSLDLQLYNALTASQRTKLESSAVLFADTNWQEGGRDIFFAFVVNPGSGELELWQALDNGGHLAPLDQSCWVMRQPWELFTNFNRLL